MKFTSSFLAIVLAVSHLVAAAPATDVRMINCLWYCASTDTCFRLIRLKTSLLRTGQSPTTMVTPLEFLPSPVNASMRPVRSSGSTSRVCGFMQGPSVTFIRLLLFKIYLWHCFMLTCDYSFDNCTGVATTLHGLNPTIPANISYNIISYNCTWSSN
jgi:hypothetical protein